MHGISFKLEWTNRDLYIIEVNGMRQITMPHQMDKLAEAIETVIRQAVMHPCACSSDLHVEQEMVE
jgi:hypothetical protein